MCFGISWDRNTGVCYSFAYLRPFRETLYCVPEQYEMYVEVVRLFDWVIKVLIWLQNDTQCWIDQGCLQDLKTAGD